jgi:SAM-dependent methyltransferase
VADTPHERIRRQELELVKRRIRPGSRVLEIGGGSGFQAALLAARSCEIASIDLAGKASSEKQGFGKQYWPVEAYDGRRLPFGDRTFDIVYSSHMLYHVEALPEFLDEIQRVQRPGGLALRLLPSASWRWWTNLTYYIDLAGRTRRVLKPRGQSGTRPPGADGGVERGARGSNGYFGRRPWVPRRAPPRNCSPSAGRHGLRRSERRGLSAWKLPAAACFAPATWFCRAFRSLSAVGWRDCLDRLATSSPCGVPRKRNWLRPPAPGRETGPAPVGCTIGAGQDGKEVPGGRT